MHARPGCQLSVAVGVVYLGTNADSKYRGPGFAASFIDTCKADGFKQSIKVKHPVALMSVHLWLSCETG